MRAVRGDHGQVLGNRLPTVPGNDDQPIGTQRISCGDRVSDEAASADLVEHLRDGGTHPGTLPCGEDEHGADWGGAASGTKGPPDVRGRLRQHDQRKLPVRDSNPH